MINRDYYITAFKWFPHIKVLKQTCKKLRIDENDLPACITIYGNSGKIVKYYFRIKYDHVQAEYIPSAEDFKLVPEAAGTSLFLELGQT
jgi:hypothetical protein